MIRSTFLRSLRGRGEKQASLLLALDGEGEGTPHILTWGGERNATFASFLIFDMEGQAQAPPPMCSAGGTSRPLAVCRCRVAASCRVVS